MTGLLEWSSHYFGPRTHPKTQIDNEVLQEINYIVSSLKGKGYLVSSPLVHQRLKYCS